MATLTFANGARREVPEQLVGRVVGLDADGDLLVPLYEGATHHLVPLTPCCHASGKGAEVAPGEGGIVCRSCYHEVAPKYGTTSRLAAAVGGPRGGGGRLRGRAAQRRERRLMDAADFQPKDRVRYSNGHDAAELGTVTSTNAHTVFVRYDSHPHAERGTATAPEDLTLVHRPAAAGQPSVAFPTGPDPDPFIEHLAADMCDQARRPARTAYHPGAWDDALREATPWPGGHRADYWRAYAHAMVRQVAEYLATRDDDDDPDLASVACGRCGHLGSDHVRRGSGATPCVALMAPPDADWPKRLCPCEGFERIAATDLFCGLPGSTVVEPMVDRNLGEPCMTCGHVGWAHGDQTPTPRPGARCHAAHDGLGATECPCPTGYRPTTTKGTS